jgi:sorting nexin-25
MDSVIGKLAIIAALSIILFSVKTSIFPQSAKKNVFGPSYHFTRPRVNWERRLQLASSESSEMSHLGSSLSPKLQSAILQIFNFIERDFISEWYDEISENTAPLNTLHQLLLATTSRLSVHLQRHFYVPQFIGSRLLPLLTLHIENWKKAKHSWKNKRSPVYLGGGERTKLSELDDPEDGELQHWLVQWFTRKSHIHTALCPSTEKQAHNHLRPIIEKLLSFLGPAQEMQSRLLLLLGREIIVCNVLYPLIDMISDPHWINTTIDTLVTDCLIIL